MTIHRNRRAFPAALLCVFLAAGATTVLAQRGPAMPRMQAFWDRVRKGDDVRWLEQIASSGEFLQREWTANVGEVSFGKELRADAYVRLGVLRTAESLAAISRVDARLRDGRTLPEPSATGWRWESPATWMGGLQVTPRADAVIGRREYAVMLLAAYSPLAPYLSWKDAGDDRWSRPRLAGEPVGSLGALEARIAAAAPDLLVSFVRPPIPPGSVQPTDVPVPQTIKIADVELDTDGDGWTDVEERTLGMDPARVDSDGDGLRDDRDVSPRHAPPPTEDADEDVRILRRAFFAVYGLTGSHFAIFVRPQLRPVQLYGLSGPVFFGVDLPARSGCGRGAQCPPTHGAEVAWRFVNRSATEVTLEFTTWQNTSFYSRTLTRLQRIGPEWIVVECRMSAIT